MIKSSNKDQISKNGEKKNFNLLQYFTKTSILAFIIIAIILGYIFRQIAIDSLVDGFKANHINIAKIISHLVTEEEFEYRNSDSSVSAKNNVLDPRVAGLNQKILNALRKTNIYKVKFYDINGITIYSTETSQIGEDKSKNIGVINALNGKTLSELVHKDKFSALEGAVLNKDLVQTYVARHDLTTGAIDGAFEIYGDATSLYEDIANKQIELISWICGLLILLYLTLLVLVRRAQGIMFEQNLVNKNFSIDLKSISDRWKFSLETSGDGVWDRDLVNNTVIYSKNYCEMFGYLENDPEIQNETFGARVRPDYVESIMAEYESFLSSKEKIHEFKMPMRCKDGSFKSIVSKCIVIERDISGNPSRLVGVDTEVKE